MTTPMLDGTDQPTTGAAPPPAASVVTLGVLRRASRETDAVVWLSLLVGILLLMPNIPPRPATIVYLLLMLGTLAVSLRYRVGLVAVVVLLAAGVGMRVALLGTAYSDVLKVTVAAIELVQQGGDPYGVGYAITNPPGSPFAYGPLTLLWYLPALQDPRVIEMAVAALILGALAIRGRPLGLALYALAPIFVTTAGDGSNDTSAGLLLLIALVVAARWPRAGAVLLGVAVAFKPYAAAWLPGLWAWGGTGALVAFVAAIAVTWGPALLIWGPASILTSFSLAERIHSQSYYSLGFLAESITGRKLSSELFGQLRLVLGVLTTLVTTPLVRTYGAMVVAGSLIYVVTLFTGYWSTHAYIAAIAPIICWHIDDWLGYGPQRVQLPGDPIGVLDRALDRRWPRRQDGAPGLDSIRRWYRGWTPSGG